MIRKTEKDFWVEMSIREIWTQAHYAEIAYGNINIKAMNVIDVVFSSIHSFLSHCAMVSKMLKAKYTESSINDIGDILGISTSSIIHKRKFRNSLEHYDRELKKWIEEKGVNSIIGTYNIGSKSMIGIPNMVFVKHYDPTENTFTFVNEDLDLGILFKEVVEIKDKADKWVKELQSQNRAKF